MSQSTICPYCNTKLRLSSSATRRNRVKCRKCNRSFHPSHVIENDGPNSYLNEPLSAPLPKIEESRSESVSTESPELTTTAALGSNVPAMPDILGESESLHTTIAEAAFPSEMLERREKRGAARERVRSDQTHAKKRTKPHELALVLGLLVAGIAGAAFLGWYLLKPSKPDSSATASTSEATPTEDGEKPVSLLEGDFSTKPLPKRLIGNWELRNDDERRGWFEFRADSTMVAYAWVGDKEAHPTREKWFLHQENGDDFVIEVGLERGQLSNLKYSLTLTGNDAFTLTQITNRSARLRENQRFVRRIAAPAVVP